MTEINPDVPTEWIERQPEQLEERLFVTTETCNSGLIAREHIAIYPDGGSYTLEYYQSGEYEFEKVTTEAEAAQIVTEWMQQSPCVT